MFFCVNNCGFRLQWTIIRDHDILKKMSHHIGSLQKVTLYESHPDMTHNIYRGKLINHFGMLN
jgi:hypothetical protein